METPTARITSDWSIEAQVPREFLARPHGSNGWCRRSENVEAFKHGDFRAVKPETLELCVANRCNKNCHFCTYAGCKVCQKLLPVGKYGQPNDVEAMSLATARRVIVEAKKAGVKGVLITGNGGDPGVCIDTPAIMEFSAENGMATMVYSNAIMWGVNYELAKRTLSPRNSVVCIRGSYNEATARVARHLAGIGSERLDLEYRGYRHVLQARDQLLQEYDVSKGSPPAVMTSIVVSERNVEDLLPICERIAAIYSSTAQYHGPFDDCVCRCATDHSRGNYEKHDHATKMVDRLLAVVGESCPGRRAIEEAGMALKLGFGLQMVVDGRFCTYDAVLDWEYSRRDCCWANGLFLNVGPDGRVYFCCDFIGKEEWQIGDLKTQSVEEVWNSDRRSACYNRVNGEHCGPAVCEATCRTCRLNQIARDLQAGRITDNELEQLRQTAIGDRWPLLS